MEKRAFFTETLAILALFMIATNAGAFNSGAHLYIAEKVFNSQNIDLYYGSVAPDIALYADQKQWPLSFENTHYNFIDLRSYAWGMTQKAFANGWLSHNEAWGADYYAHIENPLSNNSCATSGMYQGYVAEKACILAKQTGIDEELAHYAVETAVDLLLRNNVDKELGRKLLDATLYRSWLDRNLLVQVLVWENDVTDWYTLVSSELTFRNLLTQYASALVLPSPYNKWALAALGAQLASQMYGEEISEAQVLAILNAAISLCKGDYRQAIETTIEAVQSRISGR